jgi:fucose permease
VTARSRTLVTCALAMAVFGLVLALPGAAFGLESVRTQLGLGLEGQARLLAVLFAGFLLGTTVSGPLADHVGLRPVLAGALLMVAVGLLWFAGSASAGHVLAAVLVLGAGGASINTTANTLVSALYPDRRSAMLTWLGLACAMGGMALPLLVLTGGGQWTIVLLGAALLSTVMSGAIVRVEEARAIHAFSWSGLRDVVGAPTFGWYLAALVCQGGNEAALAGWLTPHLTARGLPGSWALTALTCHWIGIVLGRLCMAVIVERLGTRMTIVS